LKTAVAQLVEHHKEKLADPTSTCQADMAASFQATIGAVLRDRLKHAVIEAQKRTPNAKQLVISGGVAANQYLRNCLQEAATKEGMTLTVPPAELCTDNGLMVAWAGLMHYKAGRVSTLKEALAFEPRARWPLASVTNKKESSA
jgi:N6-L-threonylcarbamoyladenine synthase